MSALEECHSRSFISKVFGGCNDLKRQVNECLAAERAKKSKKNRETGQEKRARIEAVWKKMDEGDYSALEGFVKK